MSSEFKLFLKQWNWLLSFDSAINCDIDVLFWRTRLNSSEGLFTNLYILCFSFYLMKPFWFRYNKTL